MWRSNGEDFGPRVRGCPGSYRLGRSVRLPSGGLSTSSNCILEYTCGAEPPGPIGNTTNNQEFRGRIVISMYSAPVPMFANHVRSSLATNSGPLSERMFSGLPRPNITSVSASITS